MTTPPTPPPSAPPPPQPPRRRLTMRTLGFVAAFSTVAVIAIAALLANIAERRNEARDPFYRVVALTDTTTDPAIWGKNFPMQYDSYLRTVDQVRTKYGGSEAVPQAPSEADPRSIVSNSRLEEDPRLRGFWAGYAFSTDFREERGHAYMLTDQELTARQRVTQQPGTCLNCHASMYAAYLRAGDGDIFAGFEKLNPMSYQEARQYVTHPISCVDCHDPGTMALRITRPAFVEGIRQMKAFEGIAEFDVNTMSTRQEMRTYVCAQCHVEYHFQGPEKRLVYPWAKGLKGDSILAYYDSTGHEDWTHAISGAPALKAQHPEFELYSQGIHARSGVACADCHMPYVRVGALKVSDHHVRSPALMINNACQTCHKLPENELLERITLIQDRTFEMRSLAIDAVLDLAYDIAAAVRIDSTNARVAQARQLQRRAQFLTDFVEAENSMGFHADQEAARLLARAIDYARLGQNALRGEVTMLPAPRVAAGEAAERRLP